MSASALPTLEERVAQLEKTTARLLAGSQERPAGSWRQVVGMFSNDELMKQVDEEGRRWRAEENGRRQP
jgi:hypothetical protein